MKRPVACLFLVVLGLATFAWAGGPDGSSPATPTPAAAVSGPSATPAAVVSGNSSVVDSLLNLMVTKGVITGAEANSVRLLPPGQQMTPLVQLLQKKGVLSPEDVASLTQAQVSPMPVARSYSSSSDTTVAATSPKKQENVAPAVVSPGTKVVAAVAPIRVLPLDPPKKEGLIPDLKIGAVKVKPYGFIKMSAVYDSSQPRGDDFPLPGFIYGDTGPNASPEFHVKARGSRLGTNFEWPDPSKRLVVTGKFEMDFEGNFSAVDNRNISSIRSSAMQIRLAYGRIDYAATDETTYYGVFGQDWTPFGSSTLPNTLETTGLGIGFGSLYERAAQVRGGFVHNFGGARTFKLLGEAAAVLPAFGNVPSASGFQIPGTTAGNNVYNVIGPGGAVIGTVTVPQTGNTGLGLANQLAYGERQGVDSGRPEVEGRLVTQFQLDKAPGVAPAQLIVSGVQAEREAIVPKGNIPVAPANSGLAANFYQAAFPTGATISSTRYGVNAQAQLPTRYFTLLLSYYHGADLRFFFAGQLYSYYNNTVAEGLKNTVTAPSIDGSASVVFGNLNGTATIAQQEPIRTSGGFAELGLPLSRWAHANPTGRMGGWTANVHYGLDEAKASDVRKASPSGGRDKSDWFFANLQYKLNAWTTLAYEQSIYRTFALPNASGVYTTLFEGVPSREWKDDRSEFSTIFTF